MQFEDYIPGMPPFAYQHIPVLSVDVPFPPNKQVVLLPQNITQKRGVVRFMNIAVTTDEVTLYGVYDGRTKSASISDIYKLGYTFYQRDLPYITTYNTTDNIYSMVWVIDLPFTDNFTIYAVNNSGSPQTIIEFGADIYIFNKDFYKYLAELKAGKDFSAPE